MAVKLRLKRMGAKQKPYYRIIAADSRSPRDGRFIEAVGTYNPLVKENSVTLDEEKIIKWLNNGAQPTDSVKSILVNQGIWSKYKTTLVKPSKPKAAKATLAQAPAKTKKVPTKKPTVAKTKKSEK